MTHTHTHTHTRARARAHTQTRSRMYAIQTCHTHPFLRALVRYSTAAEDVDGVSPVPKSPHFDDSSVGTASSAHHATPEPALPMQAKKNRPSPVFQEPFEVTKGRASFAGATTASGGQGVLCVVRRGCSLLVTEHWRTAHCQHHRHLPPPPPPPHNPTLPKPTVTATNPPPPLSPVRLPTCPPTATTTTISANI
jgi:hypothetical protein